MIPDTTMLLIICYVFGILTAAALHLIVFAPLEKERARRAYHAGYLDGLQYAEGANDDY